MTYPIEKDVPVPVEQPQYPLREMEVGDSFFVEGSTTASPAYQSAYQYGARSGKKFIGRKVEGGLRIWREA